MVPPWRESGLLEKERVRHAAPGHEAKKEGGENKKKDKAGLNREYKKRMR